MTEVEKVEKDPDTGRGVKTKVSLDDVTCFKGHLFIKSPIIVSLMIYKRVSKQISVTGSWIWIWTRNGGHVPKQHAQDIQENPGRRFLPLHHFRHHQRQGQTLWTLLERRQNKRLWGECGTLTTESEESFLKPACSKVPVLFGSKVYVAEITADTQTCAKRNVHSRKLKDIMKVCELFPSFFFFQIISLKRELSEWEITNSNMQVVPSCGKSKQVHCIHSSSVT